MRLRGFHGHGQGEPENRSKEERARGRTFMNGKGKKRKLTCLDRRERDGPSFFSNGGGIHMGMRAEIDKNFKMDSRRAVKQQRLHYKGAMNELRAYRKKTRVDNISLLLLRNLPRKIRPLARRWRKFTTSCRIQKACRTARSIDSRRRHTRSNHTRALRTPRTEGRRIRHRIRGIIIRPLNDRAISHRLRKIWNRIEVVQANIRAVLDFLSEHLQVASAQATKYMRRPVWLSRNRSV
jgi:hypothetical protein